MKSILDELQAGSVSSTPSGEGSRPTMGGDIEMSRSLIATSTTPATQLLFFNKLNIHTPESGINSLVDSAAYLFYLMGKLQGETDKQDLAELHAELVDQIQQYQDAIYTCHYDPRLISEYISAATYAICFTFDDIIMDATWGGIAEWQPYSLVQAFFSEVASKDNFMIILERLTMDSNVYIDAIELMYICLNFGFKNKNILGGHIFSYDEAEEISHALYRRVMACRGQGSKLLSPFPIRPRKQSKQASMPDTDDSYFSDWQSIVAVCSFVIVTMLSGAGYLKTYIMPENSAAVVMAKVKNNRASNPIVNVRAHENA